MGEGSALAEGVGEGVSVTGCKLRDTVGVLVSVRPRVGWGFVVAVGIGVDVHSPAPLCTDTGVGSESGWGR